MKLGGMRVLITGASSGIGRAAAIEFAKRGARTVLVARRKDRLREAAADAGRAGAESAWMSCDVSDRRQVESLRDDVIGRFGGIDILVNNAGFAIYKSVARMSIAEIEAQMKTNYMGMIHCTKCFLPGMLERDSGHIVNVASVAASFGLPGIAPYCASKFAMLGFSEGLRHELAGTNVGVTVVSPITVRTEFFDGESFDHMPKDFAVSLDPARVARAIIGAAGSRRLEIIVPAVARGAVWLKHTVPYVINPVIAGYFRRHLDAADL